MRAIVKDGGLRFQDEDMSTKAVSVYGKNLTFVRNLLSLSKRKLSKIAGVKYQTIQRLEKGEQQETSISTGLKLADALQIDIEHLVRFDLQQTREI